MSDWAKPDDSPTPTEAILACARCGKVGVLGAVPGFGYQVFCNPCGLGVPFPPTSTKSLAVTGWNEHVRQSKPDSAEAGRS